LYNQKRFTDTNLSTMQIIWYTSKSSFFACSLEFLFWQIYASEQCFIHIFANTLYALFIGCNFSKRIIMFQLTWPKTWDQESFWHHLAKKLDFEVYYIICIVDKLVSVKRFWLYKMYFYEGADITCCKLCKQNLNLKNLSPHWYLI
jgi:hypothetical protein